MAGVSVDKIAVQSGIGVCRTCIQELQKTSMKLQNSYQQAGASGWKDQKYSDLGRLINECCTALNKPVQDLQSCQSTLETMASTIDEYNDVNM